MGITFCDDLVWFYGNPLFSRGKWGSKTVNKWRFLEDCIGFLIILSLGALLNSQRGAGSTTFLCLSAAWIAGDYHLLWGYYWECSLKNNAKNS